jgi:hypothetical protein
MHFEYFSVKYKIKKIKKLFSYIKSSYAKIIQVVQNLWWYKSLVIYYLIPYYFSIKHIF